jgi:hypothetical protein
VTHWHCLLCFLAKTKRQPPRLFVKIAAGSFVGLSDDLIRNRLVPLRYLGQTHLLNEDDEISDNRREKIERVMELMEMLVAWHDDVKNLPRPLVLSVFTMGARIQRLVGGDKSSDQPNSSTAGC